MGASLSDDSGVSAAVLAGRSLDRLVSNEIILLLDMDLWLDGIDALDALLEQHSQDRIENLCVNMRKPPPWPLFSLATLALSLS